MKKLQLIHLLVVLAAALSVTARAQGAQPDTTSLKVPLSATVSVPLSDGSFDTVVFTGQVHEAVHAPAQPRLAYEIMGTRGAT
jgi:hypothetical protein